jgi:hypothetical protein
MLLIRSLFHVLSFIAILKNNPSGFLSQPRFVVALQHKQSY